MRLRTNTTRVSIAIVDSNPDFMSVDVSYVSGHTIGQCTHDPILAAEMVIGDFRLH